MSKPPNPNGRAAAMFLAGVIGIAAVGYVVGINDGVPRSDDATTSNPLLPHDTRSAALTPINQMAIPAAAYREMRRSTTGPTSNWNSALDQIPQTQQDLFAQIKPSEDAKQRSAATRASRRAFNGAPPVIPHAIERTTDSACYACHGQGLRIGNQLANRMSHGFLANCTQCHAPPPPKPFAQVDATVETNFVGLPAPPQGQRAYLGAPPTIPHSTWMRQQCLACHGNDAGWDGMQTTHPWRTNCTQCHAPSAELEQAITSRSIGFVPAPIVNAK